MTELHGREVLPLLRSARVASVSVRASVDGLRATVRAGFSTAAGPIPERRMPVEPGTDNVLRALGVPRAYRSLSALAQAEARRVTAELVVLIGRDPEYRRYRDLQAVRTYQRNLAARADVLAKEAVQKLGMQPADVAAVVEARARHWVVQQVMET